MRLPSAKSCPDEVSAWMKTWSYKPHQIPFISNIDSYYRKWTTWWTSCQLAWCQNKGWPLLMDILSYTNWGIKASACGQNGLFLIIMLTAWWASSIKSKKDWARFDEAVEDIWWVIDQAINSLEVLPVPTPPASPNATQEPPPILGVKWMSCADGKRQVKPSCWLLEGRGI